MGFSGTVRPSAVKRKIKCGLGKKMDWSLERLNEMEACTCWEEVQHL